MDGLVWVKENTLSLLILIVVSSPNSTASQREGSPCSTDYQYWLNNVDDCPLPWRGEIPPGIKEQLVESLPDYGKLLNETEELLASELCTGRCRQDAENMKIHYSQYVKANYTIVLDKSTNMYRIVWQYQPLDWEEADVRHDCEAPWLASTFPSAKDSRISCALPVGPYNHGKTVKCTCAKGRSPDGPGSMVSRCDKKTGKWTQLQTCEFPACGGAPDLSRSHIVAKNTRSFAYNHQVGDPTFYNCEHGYIPSAIMLRRSHRDAMDLQEIYTVDDVGNPTKSIGFELTLFCSKNKLWIWRGFGSDQAIWPYCERIDCGVRELETKEFNCLLESQFNVKGSKTRLGDQLLCNCKPGYHIRGNMTTSVSTCTAEGKWTHTESCKIIQCPIPLISDPTLSCAEPKSLLYNESYIKCSCVGGYRISAEQTRILAIRGWRDTTMVDIGMFARCLVDGTWTRLTGCEPIRCGKPTISAEALYCEEASNEDKLNSVISCRCKTGYYPRLNGAVVTQAEVTCLSKGSWSQVPSCVKAECSVDILKTGVEGATMITLIPKYIDRLQFGYGDRLSFRCNNSSYSFRITCDHNSNWIGIVDCDEIPDKTTEGDTGPAGAAGVPGAAQAAGEANNGMSLILAAVNLNVVWLILALTLMS